MIKSFNFKSFIYLIKPRIVFGNLITAIAGFCLGSQGIFNLCSFMAMIFGLSGIVASACVFNNFFDQDIDCLMERTRQRLASYQHIPKLIWLSYGFFLLICGCSILFFFTNTYTFLVALSGFFIYVFFYTRWTKRQSHWSTIIGSFSGATPPVIGYLATDSQSTIIAVIFFLLLASWQIPHTLAIALYRLEDYSRADVKLLPVVKGPIFTQWYAIAWLLIFICILFSLLFFTFIHWVWVCMMLTIALYWLFCGVLGVLQHVDFRIWGKKMFLISLLNIFSISAFICLGSVF